MGAAAAPALGLHSCALCLQLSAHLVCMAAGACHMMHLSYMHGWAGPGFPTLGVSRCSHAAPVGCLQSVQDIWQWRCSVQQLTTLCREVRAQMKGLTEGSAAKRSLDHFLTQVSGSR